MKLKDIYNIINKELNNSFLYYFNKKQLKDFEYLLNEYDEDDYYDYLPKDYLLDNDSIYKRIKIKELSNENFEFVIIIWNPNSETKIHDHPSKGCLLKVLNGFLEEEIYDSELNFLAYFKLKQNDISYIEGNQNLHKITNNTNSHSISLHIYSPPNYIPNYY